MSLVGDRYNLFANGTHGSQGFLLSRREEGNQRDVMPLTQGNNVVVLVLPATIAHFGMG
jgi:hypothetical protein